jgi:hypothetical protein
MESFRRKARLVAGGNSTETPKCMTYSSVVSRESVRIALTLASLNALEVKAGDIENAYITAPITEKVWTTLGPEFGADEGKRAIIVRALYGLKSAGAAFRAHLADMMRVLGYRPCMADQDLWMKPEIKPVTNEKYWSYVLCYVDDVLVVAHDAATVLDRIGKFFKLKPDPNKGDPDMYLGAKLRKTVMPNGVEAWTLSPSKYVQEAVRNCKKFVDANLPKHSMPKAAPNPFVMGYVPELDDSKLLDAKAANYYQSLIGVLRWCIEIGRIDLCTEVSLLSAYLAAPREGHLDAALHVMAHLKQKHNTRLTFDPTYPDINFEAFNYDKPWVDFYGDVAEPVPMSAPEPRGKPVDLRAFVDSDHAGEKTTRRSRTGYLIYLNNALIT